MATSPRCGRQPEAGGKADETPEAALGKFRGLWIGVSIFAVVLLFLLIFILQNPCRRESPSSGARGTLPTGVALLLAAIGGVLLVAIPGGLRIMQLRRAARRGRGTR